MAAPDLELKKAFSELQAKMIETKHGKDFLWLLYPQDSANFDEFMKHKPDPKYLNYVYKNKKYFSQSV